MASVTPFHTDRSVAIFKDEGLASNNTGVSMAVQVCV